MSGKSMRMGSIAVALGAVFLSGCAARSINHIMADPHRYVSRDVGIRGEVIESYSVVGHGVYRVDDGTGRLWVVSEKGVPRKGAKVEVRGEIKDGYDLGDLSTLVKIPERLGNGMVMIEKKHKARF